MTHHSPKGGSRRITAMLGAKQKRRRNHQNGTEIQCWFVQGIFRQCQQESGSEDDQAAAVRFTIKKGLMRVHHVTDGKEGQGQQRQDPLIQQPALQAQQCQHSAHRQPQQHQHNKRKEELSEPLCADHGPNHQIYHNQRADKPADSIKGRCKNNQPRRQLFAVVVQHFCFDGVDHCLNAKAYMTHVQQGIKGEIGQLGN